MTEPEPHEFDALRDRYDDEITKSIEFAGQEHDFYLRIKANHLVDLTCKTFGSENKIKALDVGCGNGSMHGLMKNDHLDLYGCDPASTVVEKARQLNPWANYTASDGETLPYSDNYFDIAFAVCVMHHVPPQNWTAFLTEMQRVVRPGGLLAIYEHNPFNPLTQYIVKSCPIDEHAVLLKSRQLKKLQKEVKLKNIRNEYIIFFPFKHKMFRLFERGLTWLPLGAQYVTYAKVA